METLWGNLSVLSCVSQTLSSVRVQGLGVGNQGGFHEEVRPEFSLKENRT